MAIVKDQQNKKFQKMPCIFKEPNYMHSFQLKNKKMVLDIIQPLFH